MRTRKSKIVQAKDHWWVKLKKWYRLKLWVLRW